MFASIADGPSEISNPLTGEDCESTVRCMEALGARIESVGRARKVFPLPALMQPEGELDCGNSGTTMRLLSGIVASYPIDVTLVGDASLSRRPMKRIAEPLRLMGAKVYGDVPPLRVAGSGELKAIDYQSPVASAQIKSCVLLAGLRAQGQTWVTEPTLSRDHTERMLRACGVEVSSEILAQGGHRVGVKGWSRPSGFQLSVPGDISSAAFWLVAAAMVAGSSVRLAGIGVNPTRTGVLDVFGQAGLPIGQALLAEALGEPVADLEVLHGEGKGFRIEGELVPRLIDEIPVLAVLATQLHGESVIRDARELKVKESDRIAKVVEGLRSMGAKIEALDDGMAIEGPAPLSGTRIQADGDHRIAMAFAIAGLIAEGETAIEGAESIATSYPNFLDDLARLQS